MILITTLCQDAAQAAFVLPDLGEAADFALLSIPIDSDPSSIKVSSFSGVNGVLGIGSPGTYTKSGFGNVVGNVYLETGVTTDISGLGSLGTLIPNSDLSQAIADALQAASDAAALTPPTQALGDVTSSLTLIGNGGINVFSANKIDLYGFNILELNGSADDYFIFNVSGAFDFSGSSIVSLTGGTQASHVLFNVIGTGNEIGPSASSQLYGTVLAPYRDFTLHGVNMSGAIIANDIWISSGGQLQQVSFSIPEEHPHNGPVIPEPASAYLVIIGLAGLATARRRNRLS